MQTISLPTNEGGSLPADPSQEMVCTLTRSDQQHEPEFSCFTYAPKMHLDVSEGLGDDLNFGQA